MGKRVSYLHCNKYHVITPDHSVTKVTEMQANLEKLNYVDHLYNYFVIYNS